MVGLALAGTIASAIPLALAIHSVGGHHRYLIAIFGPIIGGAFIGTGLLAWVRQPDNRFGALMVALGFAYCLSGLMVATELWSFILGLHLILLPYAILLHILVAFPTGRLHNRAERVLVGAGWLTATVVWWGVMLIEDTSRLGLPANHLLVADEADLFDTLATRASASSWSSSSSPGVVLIRRWAEASRAQRRALAPVYVSGRSRLSPAACRCKYRSRPRRSSASLSTRAGPAGQGPAGFAADHPGDPRRPAARPSPRGSRADPS